jgi:hypothetical protein
MTEQTLSDKIFASYQVEEMRQIIPLEDVKDFIKETLSDIEGGYEGEELLVRIRKRAGEALTK